MPAVGNCKNLLLEIFYFVAFPSKSKFSSKSFPAFIWIEKIGKNKKIMPKVDTFVLLLLFTPVPVLAQGFFLYAAPFFPVASVDIK